MAFNVSDEVLSVYVPVMVYWTVAAIYTFIGTYLEDYRLHPVGAEEKQNVATKAQVIRGVLYQQIGQIVMQTIVTKMVMGDGGGETKQPPFLICLCQFFIAMVVLDLWQYLGHIYLHVNKFMYKHIHSWHHALVVPYAWGAFYNHPLEGFILDTIGGGLAFLISGMTPRTSIFFYSFASIKSIDMHSSLYLPWNPLRLCFRNNVAYHDIHHRLKGSKYNYAQPFFMSWDLVFGTYMPFSVEKREGGGFEARPLKDM
ncbi:sphinganine C4-monooxygenase 1-like [Dioscorea cayenensis subsp. rotundata]|uniref:aldehyde oxygenase (deformylating) n=1 Tax=Dioscorea cayennensis subsp. rotundata TaxID=55577 RepID=A0AB40BEW9_DIOCR|nr:sphinganine C4-monooxygenase 1-like [Dioscorea cayenensis subsp. rotundata]XP_039125858.1 sphinganine C4-monooxygenase 1-like [Dioscorea cayenensis subsp. rotundata]